MTKEDNGKGVEGVYIRGDYGDGLWDLSSIKTPGDNGESGVVGRIDWMCNQRMLGRVVFLTVRKYDGDGQRVVCLQMAF